MSKGWWGGIKLEYESPAIEVEEAELNKEVYKAEILPIIFVTSIAVITAAAIYYSYCG